MLVKRLDGELSVSFPFDQISVQRMKSMPQARWRPAAKLWTFKPTLANIDYFCVIFPDAVWDEQASALREQIREYKRMRDLVAQGKVDTSDPLTDVPFKTRPFDHQRKALILGRDQEAFGYLMEQGTGKTKVLIDDAAHNFRKGRINGVLVIAPNSVKTNWCSLDGVDQLSRHMPDDIRYAAAAWYASMRGDAGLAYKQVQYADKQTLAILVVNCEALHVDRCFKDLERFCESREVMIVVDESTRIKNRTTQRTKAAMKLRTRCKLARILSGTPLIKSPLDSYSQFNFLDPNILGFPSYASFQARFAYMGGYLGKQVLSYRNLDELQRSILGASYRVTKAECLDLPEKVYDVRHIEMTKEQAAFYKKMREDAFIRLSEDNVVKAPVVLTQLLRLQQITSGYLPIINSDDQSQTGTMRINKRSPKVAEALDIIEQTEGKVIVWCRFIPELKEMAEALKEAGVPCVTFYGDTNEQERVRARTEFQDRESAVRVFVGQIRTGGIGLDLYAASTVIYLSNSFSTEDRVQSEDRAHRIGQDKSVQYIDLICPGTIDTKIIGVLRKNMELSASILNDGWRGWI